MINIVHDNLPHSNVWFAPKIYEVAFSFRHNKPLPFFLHLNNNLTFHTSADGLDSFIYPVVMPDPYIQVASLIMNSNPYGFWSHVSDNVIKALREKRGWVIIDLYSEPITQRDFTSVIQALSDSSKFPNDRILLNITSPHFTNHKPVFCHPSYLEMGCYVPEFQNSYPPCLCTCGFEPEADYPRNRFLLLNNHMDYPVAQVFAKYAKTHSTRFLDSSSDVLGVPNPKTKVSLPHALYANDLNVVLEAYVDNDEIEYPFITEKTYRNFRFKKPFILMGNRYSLAVLRKLGYKTFHPLIDESYDSVKHTKDRCRKIIKELERLRGMSDAEWDNLLFMCEPIVEHNYNNLMSRIKQTNTWLEGLKDL
ncbi:hypothetical protein OAV13_00580 [bacterium]|nr:hypothetical protein [bacterium]